MRLVFSIYLDPETLSSASSLEEGNSHGNEKNKGQKELEDSLKQRLIFEDVIPRPLKGWMFMKLPEILELTTKARDRV